MSAQRRRTILMLLQHGPLQTKQVHEICGWRCRVKTVGRLLAELRQEGVVSRTRGPHGAPIWNLTS